MDELSEEQINLCTKLGISAKNVQMTLLCLKLAIILASVGGVTWWVGVVAKTERDLEAFFVLSACGSVAMFFLVKLGFRKIEDLGDSLVFHKMFKAEDQLKEFWENEMERLAVLLKDQSEFPKREALANAIKEAYKGKTITGPGGRQIEVSAFIPKKIVWRALALTQATYLLKYKIES